MKLEKILFAGIGLLALVKFARARGAGLISPPPGPTESLPDATGNYSAGDILQTNKGDELSLQFLNPSQSVASWEAGIRVPGEVRLGGLGGPLVGTFMYQNANTWEGFRGDFGPGVSGNSLAGLLGLYQQQGLSTSSPIKIGIGNAIIFTPSSDLQNFLGGFKSFATVG